MIDSFRGKYRFLSNFHPCAILWGGEEYPSVEHAYQASKTFDSKLREKIRFCKTPAEAKKMGKAVPLRDDWDEIKVSIMQTLVYLKFVKNKELRDLLLATEPEHLEEGNTWGDTFWGVCKGEGKNLLGRILMDIRRILLGKR